MLRASAALASFRPFLVALLAVVGAVATPAPRHAWAQGIDPALPDSAYARARYVKRVERIPMRDGVTLFTQLYIPRDAGPAGTRYPLVVTRTPFSTGSAADSVFPAAIAPDAYMLRDGYIFVQQEVRGRYRSEGQFENVRPRRTGASGTDEVTDADDTIRWLLAHVSGHNGRVALHGTSYGGFYAAMGALSRHPAIRALSLQAPVADYWHEDFHHNGAFVLTSLWAVPIFGTPRPAPTAAHWWAGAFAQIPDSAMVHDYAWLRALGSLRNTAWLSNDAWWQSLVAHPDYDAFWRARALPPQLQGLTVPTLLVGGWFDAENLYGTLAVQRALSTRSRGAPMTLVMGPFGHRQWSARDEPHATHGALYFGDSLATRFQRDVEARFFRSRLKNDGPSLAAGARVFDTGAMQWRTMVRWPDADVRQLTWQLGAGGVLDTLPVRAGSQSWTSDPRIPVPSRCTGTTIEEGSPNLVMSDDQRCLLSRGDVLTFVTAPLRRALTVSGPITASLGFSTTGTDADLVVKLIDVYPAGTPDHAYRADTSVHLAGYHQLVRGEILRGRYRHGGATPQPFRANERTTVVVALPDVLHTFKAGHRLMIQVQSSWFPLFDRNPQTYVPNIFAARDTDFEVAQHTLWFGGRDGSAVRVGVAR